MRSIVQWGRLLLGLAGAVVLLVATVAAAVTNTSEPALTRLTLLLGGVAFAVLLKGWGLKGRYPGLGRFTIDIGVGVFGFAMLGFIVQWLGLPVWLSWLVFAVFVLIAAAFVRQVMFGPSALQPVQVRDGQLEVRSSRARALLVVGLAAIMTTASFVVLSAGGVLAGAFGAIGVLFFGSAGLWALQRALWPGPLLVADRRGLTDRSSLFGVGRVGWDEIADVRLVHQFQQCHLALIPRDRDAFLASRSTVRRWWVRVSRVATRSDVVLIGLAAGTADPGHVLHGLQQLRGVD